MATDVPRALSSATVQAISTQTQMLVMQNHTGNPSDALFLGLLAASGSLDFVAALIGKQVSDNPADAVSNQSLLMAGLLFSAAAKANGSAAHDDGGISKVMMSLGPKELITAFEWYEQITGEKPDQYFNPGMVEAIHRYAEEAETPLKDFLGKRPTPGNKTLN